MVSRNSSCPAVSWTMFPPTPIICNYCCVTFVSLFMNLRHPRSLTSHTTSRRGASYSKFVNLSIYFGKCRFVCRSVCPHYLHTRLPHPLFLIRVDLFVCLCVRIPYIPDHRILYMPDHTVPYTEHPYYIPNKYRTTYQATRNSLVWNTRYILSYVRPRNLYWYLVIRTCFLLRLIRVMSNLQNRHHVCLYPGRYLPSSIRVNKCSKLFAVHQLYGITGGGMRSTKHGAQLFNFVHISFSFLSFFHT